MSPTSTGWWKLMASMATVASRPRARVKAAVPAAMSICANSQPPKISPEGLVSAGMARVRTAGCRSRRSGIGSLGLVIGERIGRQGQRELGATGTQGQLEAGACLLRQGPRDPHAQAATGGRVENAWQGHAVGTRRRAGDGK